MYTLSHLNPTLSIEQNIRGLEVAVDGVLVVQESHASANALYDLPGPRVRKPLFAVAQKRAQVTARE